LYNNLLTEDYIVLEYFVGEPVYKNYLSAK